MMDAVLGGGEVALGDDVFSGRDCGAHQVTAGSVRSHFLTKTLQGTC